MVQLNKVGRANTKIINDGKFTIIHVHQTDVVKFNNKKIILDTGGWKTQMTKNRMNQASNQYDLYYYVHNIRGEWVVNYRAYKNGIYGVFSKKFINNKCIINRKIK